MSQSAATAAPPPRRKVVAVVGDNCLDAAAMEPGMAAGDEQHKQQLAEEVGQAIVDAGHRVLTGGLAGVMDAAMKGARSSSRYREGDTIAVLPGEDPAAASSNADIDPEAAGSSADIVICTGLGSYRNGIVGRADAVIAVGGGAGTLQEICIAWKAARLVVVMAGVSGATSALAGKCIDGRDVNARSRSPSPAARPRVAVVKRNWKELYKLPQQAKTNKTTEQGSMQAAGMACQKRSAAGSRDDCTIMVDGSSTAAAATPAAAAAAAAPAVRSKPRTYYVDWLRVFLTVLVLLHHCLTEYLSTWKPWKARKGDTAHWLLVQLFVNGNQAYFMTLFFFLSGLYVPPSYKRKGPWEFLKDRTLRLVIPCLFYSMIIAPFNIWWVKHTTDPKATMGQAFAEWFAPGWPTKYVLPTGPPWFIWMLWCFNVAYVIIKVMVDSAVGKKLLQAVCKACRKGDDAAAALPQQGNDKKEAAGSAAKPAAPSCVEYTTKQWLVGGAVLTFVLFVLMFATRVLDMLAFNLRPAVFVSQGPFVAFMPDYFVVYVVAFGLGIYSGPASWNVLARMPSGYAAWWLSISGIWWVLGGLIPNILLLRQMSLQFGMGAFMGSWMLRTFVEQSFCVVWSAGLLVLFREAFNIQPKWLGRQIINGAYGAYIIHPPIIILFARAVMGLDALAPSAVINAAVISLPVVVCAWAVAATVRAIPGFDRVL
ncbi:hypothetical protein OEZ85_004866 [Tetradesmus obliquus]|uniref:Acyltransferase 3 domain-containing protein n=1 Tax=Tetradesmus obliquus TaxID=3088 RepID=A0ABY8UGH3_TETOB|nr:hypothetical protein OEZ85_004866 [Tetradesmus obliquus]